MFPYIDTEFVVGWTKTRGIKKGVYTKLGWLPWTAPFGSGGMRHIIWDHIIRKPDFQVAYDIRDEKEVARFILKTVNTLFPQYVYDEDQLFKAWLYNIPGEDYPLIVVYGKATHHIHSAYPLMV